MDMRAINPAIIDEYRRSGGTLSGELAGIPVLVLTTAGRRTGTPHITPLGYIEDAGRFIVPASAAGAPSDPDWYRNLVITPAVTVEVGADTYDAEASVAAGPERRRLFDQLASTLPPLAGYAATAGREIPVVVLTPRTSAARLATAAARLRSLHRRGDPLVLVNAWDVASARHVVAAGASAVATSSAAIAATLGVPDDHTAPVDAMFEVLARITASVDVPVTADLLDGYGLDADELLERLLAAGAVGCNLEDSDHRHPETLTDPDTAAARIAAVRAAATRAGVDVVVNARIDSYIHIGPDATPDVVARARRYLDAGADCVYPVRLTDPEVTRRLVDEIDAAVNANAAGETSIADLAAAGASRISTGPMAFHAAIATLDQLTARLLADPTRNET